MDISKIENLAASLSNEIGLSALKTQEYYRGAREGIQELVNAIKKVEEKEANAAEGKPTLSEVKAESAKS